MLFFLTWCTRDVRAQDVRVAALFLLKWCAQDVRVINIVFCLKGCAQDVRITNIVFFLKWYAQDVRERPRAVRLQRCVRTGRTETRVV